MPEAAGTLAGLKIARLAEIVLPGIGVILRGGLVEHQSLVVEPAAIGVALVVRTREAALQIAVTPVHERLRVGVGRRLFDRKAHLRVDGAIRQATGAMVT